MLINSRNRGLLHIITDSSRWPSAGALLAYVEIVENRVTRIKVVTRGIEALFVANRGAVYGRRPRLAVNRGPDPTSLVTHFKWDPDHEASKEPDGAH